MVARRKSFGSFGRKRKSYGKAFRLNTKGGIPTSVSVGGGGIRVNVGKRGTRTTVRNPITSKSTTVGGGRLEGSRKHRASTQSRSNWNQRTGKERVVVPLNAVYDVTLTVDLGEYTHKRLLTIQDATKRGDIKRQARELFKFVKGWNLEMDQGKIARRDHKALSRMPNGFALVLAIEVGNRTGVLVEPIDSGLVIDPNQRSAWREVKNDLAPEIKMKRKGLLRRLWPF